MRKIKHWFFRRFLPEWCRLGLLEENEKLRCEVAAMKHKNREQAAYIDGMEACLRMQRRVSIHNAVGKGE